MDYSKFQCKRIEEVAKHRDDLSSYCHNFYEDDEGNIIYANSDDDNYTDYCLVTFDGKLKHFHKTFAESYTSEGDIMEVFSEFLNIKIEF
jgi:hypothetical protein